jgi:hypothetical protein
MGQSSLSFLANFSTVATKKKESGAKFTKGFSPEKMCKRCHIWMEKKKLDH